jgi:hypothetical protein
MVERDIDSSQWSSTKVAKAAVPYIKPMHEFPTTTPFHSGASPGRDECDAPNVPGSLPPKPKPLSGEQSLALQPHRIIKYFLLKKTD